MKTAIITGISGQDGSYLAKLLVKKTIKLLGWSEVIDVQKLQILNIFV